MTSLAVADIHLTSKADEEERWGLFPWLCEQVFKNAVDEVVIAGDGTEAKDRHTGALVNRMTENVKRLVEEDVRVFWIRGNHDGIDPNQPFFNFLEVIDGVQIITKPTAIKFSIGKVILLPNTANYKEDWKDLNFADYDYAFAHQTFSGAVSETGYRLVEGLPPNVLDAVKVKAFSGDIHVPQKFGRKGEYIGAPYRTRFGDTYDGRCLLIDNVKGKHKQTDLHYPTKGKHVATIRSLEDLDDYKIPQGGSVKVRVRVSRADLPTWQDTKAKVKARVKELGWELHDVELERIEVAGRAEGVVPIRSKTTSPRKVFDEYAKAKIAPNDVVTMGRGILAKLGVK